MLNFVSKTWSAVKNNVQSSIDYVWQSEENLNEQTLFPRQRFWLDSLWDIARHVSTQKTQLLTLGFLFQASIVGANRTQYLSSKVTYNLDLQIDPTQVPIVNEPLQIILRSNINTPGSALDIIISGNLSYIADSSEGLQIIDVSNTSFPILVGGFDTSGFSQAVTLKDTLIFLADGNDGLKVFDVSTPEQIILVQVINTIGEATDVAISDNFVYFIDSGFGLRILDITNRSQLNIVGSYREPLAYDVTVSDNIAYIPSKSGLLIIDVTKPTIPMLLGTYDTTSAFEVVLSEGIAYILEPLCLKILDVSDPTNPQLISSYFPQSQNQLRRLFISGHLIFLTNQITGLEIIDVSRLEMSKLLARYITPGLATGIYIDKDSIYIADGASGLEILEITNSLPILESNDINIRQGEPIILDSGHLRASDMEQNPGELIFIASDIFETTFLCIETNLSVTFFSQQQVFNKNVMLIPSGSQVAPVFRISVSDGIARTQPKQASVNFIIHQHLPILAFDNVLELLEESNIQLNIDSITLKGALAYIVGKDTIDGTLGLKIVDFSNIAFPNVIGSINVNCYNSGVELFEDLVFVMCGEDSGINQGVHLIDVNFPVSPKYLANYLGLSMLQDILVSDTLLILASLGSGVHIIDISNPYIPTKIGGYNATISPSSLAMVDTFVFIGDYNLGLNIIDITEPSEPLLVSNYSGSFSRIVVKDSIVFLGSSFQGLKIIDTTNLNILVLIGNINENISDLRISNSGSLIYIMTNNLYGELLVIDVSNPFSPVIQQRYVQPRLVNSMTISEELIYLSNEPFGLQIVLYDSMPRLINNTLDMPKNGILRLTDSNIQSYDLNDESFFYVISLPIQGGFFRDTQNTNVISITEFSQQQLLNGQIEFVHDGSNTVPYYEVSVSDGIARTVPAPVSGNLIPNLAMNQLNFLPGEGIILTANELMATDVNNAADELMLMINGLQHGMMIDMFINAAVTNFTQQRVLNGEIVYQHDGSNQPATYEVIVSDGRSQTLPQRVSSNFRPVLEINRLQLSQGGSVTLNHENLRASDLDNDENTLVFTVGGVQGGAFNHRGQGTTVTSFTQFDVNNGDIVFEHNGDDVGPSYQVSVSDGRVETQPQAAQITFSGAGTDALLLGLIAGVSGACCLLLITGALLASLRGQNHWQHVQVTKEEVTFLNLLTALLLKELNGENKTEDLENKAKGLKEKLKERKVNFDAFQISLATLLEYVISDWSEYAGPKFKINPKGLECDKADLIKLMRVIAGAMRTEAAKYTSYDDVYDKELGTIDYLHKKAHALNQAVAGNIYKLWESIFISDKDLNRYGIENLIENQASKFRQTTMSSTKLDKPGIAKAHQYQKDLFKFYRNWHMPKLGTPIAFKKVLEDYELSVEELRKIKKECGDDISALYYAIANKHIKLAYSKLCIVYQNNKQGNNELFYGLLQSNKLTVDTICKLFIKTCFFLIQNSKKEKHNGLRSIISERAQGLDTFIKNIAKEDLVSTEYYIKLGDCFWDLEDEKEMLRCYSEAQFKMQKRNHGSKKPKELPILEERWKNVELLGLYKRMQEYWLSMREAPDDALALSIPDEWVLPIVRKSILPLMQLWMQSDIWSMIKDRCSAIVSPWLNSYVDKIALLLKLTSTNKRRHTIPSWYKDTLNYNVIYNKYYLPCLHFLKSNSEHMEILNGLLNRLTENVKGLKQKQLGNYSAKLEIELDDNQLGEEINEQEIEPIIKIEIYSNIWRKKLQGYRQEFKSSFYSKHNLTDDWIKLQKGYTTKIKKLLGEIIETVAKWMGEPPVAFAVVGLGSLSREAVFPYSDSDLLLLHEDTQDKKTRLYFEEFFKVLMPFAIELLGELEGLHMDVGDKSLSLGCTQLFTEQWQQFTDNNLKLNSVAPELYSVLHASELYASDKQNSIWEKNYSSLLKQLMIATTHKSALNGNNHQVIGQAYWESHQHDRVVNKEKYLEKGDIKDGYLSPLTYWLTDLALYHGIEKRAIFEVIDELASEEKNIITQETNDGIKTALRFIHQLRIKNHFDAQYGKDTINSAILSSSQTEFLNAVSNLIDEMWEISDLSNTKFPIALKTVENLMELETPLLDFNNNNLNDISKTRVSISSSSSSRFFSLSNSNNSEDDNNNHHHNITKAPSFGKREE